ncbi:hypothetical protein ACNOYE_11845 [Nannocystaceae bacterium ST9]
MPREQTESEVERAWLDEVERRIERARTGEEPSLEGNAVIARLRAKLLAYRHQRET